MTVNLAPGESPGAKLRAARERAGFDRRKVAAELGITYQRLADIEADRKAITLEQVHRISLAIGCDPHEIDARLASNRTARGRPPRPS